MDIRHEEADTIIAQKVVMLASQGKGQIKVICDDTDVFILLLHYYKLCSLTCGLLMVGSSKGGKCTDIKATVEEHDPIVDGLLCTHALSGCDTTSQPFGIGKLSVLKVLKSGKE